MESRQAPAAVGRRQGSPGNDPGTDRQVNQLRTEINGVTQQINRLPRYRGRLANNYAQEEYAELVAYRNQLNFTLTQQRALLGQVRSQPPDPKSRRSTTKFRPNTMSMCKPFTT